MQDFMHAFVMTFVPLFIVIDAVGILTFVVKACEGLSLNEQRKVAHISVGTAAVVGLVFLFFGRLILNIMNISVGSFAVAGGVILLVLSIRELVTGQYIDVEREALTAIVPIGTPLLAGPATITALLLLTNQYQFYIVVISYLLNLLLAWVILMGKDYILRFMGIGGVRAVSNVFNLLLASIAVSMVLEGFNLIGIIKIG